MPLYTFKDKNKNIEYDKELSYEDLQEYIKQDHIEQVFKMNIFCWEGYNQKKFLKDFPHKINSSNFISDFQIANQINKKEVKCDIININNAFIRDFLWKNKIIKALDYKKYHNHSSYFLKDFKYLSRCC